jgi:hypothetical protein
VFDADVRVLGPLNGACKTAVIPPRANLILAATMTGSFIARGI